MIWKGFKCRTHNWWLIRGESACLIDFAYEQLNSNCRSKSALGQLSSCSWLWLSSLSDRNSIDLFVVTSDYTHPELMASSPKWDTEKLNKKLFYILALSCGLFMVLSAFLDSIWWASRGRILLLVIDIEPKRAQWETCTEAAEKVKQSPSCEFCYYSIFIFICTLFSTQTFCTVWVSK